MLRTLIATVIVVALVPVVAMGDSAQDPPAAWPTFEVSSVKPNMSGAIAQSSQTTKGSL